jgi:serine protease Do
MKSIDHKSVRLGLGVVAALLLLSILGLTAWGVVVPVSASGSSPAIVAQASPRPAANPRAGVMLPENYPWVGLAESLMPAVVNVRTSGEARRPRTPTIPEPFRRFFPQPEPGERGERPRGLGSGFIIDSSGYIVTNHHVVQGAQAVEVTLADGRTFTAKLVGSDQETDLALLKIEAQGLPTIPLGTSSSVRVAEPVMAIGNPFGLDHTVTVGIVSGTGRYIGQGRYDDFLQTDAAINPGNSGGPLINTRGEAIGINSAIRSNTGGFQGVGFAIPSDLAKPIIQQLRSSGKVTRGWLGVSIQPLTAELAKSFGLTGTQGALVASVVEDSPAARGGLKPGDIIVRYDGKPVESPRALPPLVANTEIGRGVELGVMRDGGLQVVRVTVGTMPETREARAPTPTEGRLAERLGLELQELTPEIARRLGVKEDRGVVVTEVRPDSPAAQAGIAAGDVIREVNRQPIQGLEDVEKGMARAGQDAKQILLRIEREGSQRYIVVAAG